MFQTREMSWGRIPPSCTAILILFPLLAWSQSPDCIQYVSSPNDPAPPLQCSSHFTSCRYVTTPTSLLLQATERQLERLLSQLQPALDNRELRRDCLNGFLFLYCLQTYGVCGQEVGGVFEPRVGMACRRDCMQVIGEDCSFQEWRFLANIVDQLRTAGVLALPPLMGLDECGATEGSGDCFNLEQVNGTSPDECTATPTPPVTSPAPPPDTLSTAAIAGICVVAAFTLLVATCLIIFILCLTRRRQRRARNQSGQPQGSKVVSKEMKESALGKLTSFEGMVNSAEKALNTSRQSSGTLMLRASTAHEALLDVNPTPRTTTLARRLKAGSFLSLSPKERLQQLEYPRGSICLVRDLWETNFGPVYVGEASGLEETDALTTVFIKSLRNQASTKLRHQFRIEMTWASGFSHPNIISLLGVCVKEDPYYVLYEYLEYGSLKEFLQTVSSMWFDFDRFLGDTTDEGGSTVEGDDRSSVEEGPNQSVFGVEDLTGMVCQVADGMDYLAKKAFILKDLATRNCQVGHNLTVKIANFGLSYDRCSEDYCCIRSHKATPVPLRWLAPETIRHNKVSVYSDIWSFGVLLWEVFSFGERPYSDLSNAAVVEAVLSGQVLPCPERCPQGVYNIMRKCWNEVPSKRPWFHTLRPELAAVPKVMNLDERKSLGVGPATPEIQRALRTLATR